jgi:hypothetical protein
VVTFCRWPRDLQRLDQITAREKRDIRLLGVSGSALMCHGGAENIRIKSEGEPHHRLHPTQSSLHQLLKPVLHYQPISSTRLFNRHTSYQGCPDPCGRGNRHRHSLLQQCQSCCFTQSSLFSGVGFHAIPTDWRIRGLTYVGGKCSTVTEFGDQSFARTDMCIESK